MKVLSTNTGMSGGRGSVRRATGGAALGVVTPACLGKMGNVQTPGGESLKSLGVDSFASRNKCLTTTNRCLTSSNKQLVITILIKA